MFAAKQLLSELLRISAADWHGNAGLRPSRAYGKAVVQGR